MKHLILILLAILSNCILFAQQKEKALEYYNLCNKAELAICDSNIDGALEYYRSAFLINPSKPFSQDLLNAFHCAMDLKQFSEAKQCLKKILYRGVKQKYLNSQIYQYYTGSNLDSIKHFVAQYPNDSNKQNAYSLKMIELVGKDQGIRQYYIKKGIVHSMGDSVVQLDKAVSNELFQYFLLIGLKNLDTMGHFGGEINNDVQYQVIVIHQKQAALRGTVAQLPFDSILYNGIFTYDYHPKYFLGQFSTGDKMSFLKVHPELEYLKGLKGAAIFSEDLVMGKLYIEELSTEVIKGIDAASTFLGLLKYDESVRMVDFRNQHQLNEGCFSKYKIENQVVSIMFCETEEGLKKWKEKFQKENHK